MYGRLVTAEQIKTDSSGEALSRRVEELMKSCVGDRPKFRVRQQERVNVTNQEEDIISAYINQPQKMRDTQMIRQQPLRMPDNNTSVRNSSDLHENTQPTSSR
jgi:hypothetical protein